MKAIGLRDTDIQWDRKMFTALKDGATWSVPSSGLIFVKRGDHLELEDVMPYLPEMKVAFDNGADIPATAGELIRHQRRGFIAIQTSFNAAGIEITDPKALLIPRHVTADDLQKLLTIKKIADTFPA